MIRDIYLYLFYDFAKVWNVDNDFKWTCFFTGTVMIGPIDGNGGGKRRKRETTDENETEADDDEMDGEEGLIKKGRRKKKKKVKYLLYEPIPPKILKVLKNIFYSPIRDKITIKRRKRKSSLNGDGVRDSWASFLLGC